MCHRCDLVLRIEKDDAAFHQVCDVDMHKWLAVQSENRSFSFRANASLGIAEDFALDFIMDVVAICRKLVVLFNHIGRKRQTAIAAIGKRSAGHTADGTNVPDYHRAARAYNDSVACVASLDRMNGRCLSAGENGK